MPAGQPDRLRSAAILGAASLAIAAASLTSLVLDFPWRPRAALSRSAATMHALDLSTLAWVPSGRVVRHPDTSHRGIDLRPSPFWPLADVAPERLLLEFPQPEARGRPAGRPLPDQP